MDTVTGALESLKNLIDMSNLGAILRIVLVFGALFLIWYYDRWKKQKAIEDARKEEDKKKNEDQHDAVDENQRETDQTQEDSKKSDDFLNNP